MPTRSLNVVIAGDARPLEAASKQAGRSLDQIGSAHKRAAKATDEHIGATGRLRTSFGSLYAHGGEAIAAVVGLEGIKKGVESVIEAYKTQEVANSALKTQMGALNQTYSAHKDAIEEVVKRTSRLSGIAVPELTSTFTVLDRATGNVHKSLDLVGTAADVAAAKHISASRAAVLLGKVASGNVTAFNRYGLSIKAGTSATDALAQIQQRFAGQAKAYGDTTAGAGDKLRASWEEVRAELGSKLAPVIAKVETGLSKFIQGALDGRGAGGEFASTVRGLAHDLSVGVSILGQHRTALKLVIGVVLAAVIAVKTITAVTKAWRAAQLALDIVLSANPIGLVVTALAALAVGLTIAYKRSTTFRNIVNGAWKDIRGVVIPVIHAIGDAVKTVFQDVMLPVIRRTVGVIKPIIGGLVDVIRGAVRVISGLLSGNWSRAWDGAKESVRGAWRVMKTVVKTGIDSLTDLIRGVGPTLVKLILKGFAGFGKSLTDLIVSGIKSGAKAIIGVAGWLKDTVVGAVKKAFGISSPSTVMLELGGHIASGLVKGITGSGIFKSILGGLGLGGGGADPSLKNAGKGGSARQWLMQALRITGQYTPANYAALYRQMMSESGGNPRAINLTDINAQQGHPSKGLLQTIDSTFQAYRLRSLPNDIYNPVANTVAAIRYMLARYGHIVGTGHGYAAGTGGARPGFAWVGEKGPELVNFFGGEQVLSHSDSMYASGMPGYAQGTPRKGRRSRTGHTGTAIQEAIALQHYLDRIHPSKGVLRDGSTADAGGIGEDAGDPNQPLIDAMNAEAEAAKALADQMAGVQGELKANRDFATSVSNTSNYQLMRFLADAVSGHLGQRVLAQAFTPGDASERRY